VRGRDEPTGAAAANASLSRVCTKKPEDMAAPMKIAWESTDSSYGADARSPRARGWPMRSLLSQNLLDDFAQHGGAKVPGLFLCESRINVDAQLAAHLFG
jgi:hypothetical protein